MPISRVDVHYCNFLALLDGPFPIGLLPGQAIDIRSFALLLSMAIPFCRLKELLCGTRYLERQWGLENILMGCLVKLPDSKASGLSWSDLVWLYGRIILLD